MLKPALMLAFFCWLVAGLLFNACSEQSTGPDVDPQLELRADAGVTEAWLALSAQYSPGAQLALLRDGQEIARFAAVADTLFSDRGLQPARQYGYQARLLHEGQSLTGAGATLTTLDTTSHQFSWRIDTLGESGSGLVDVAIIAENDIWAVGEIHTPETDRRDSLGNWVPPYNAAHWNGQVWEFIRIPYVYEGQSFYHPISFAFLFDTGVLWFGGNGIVQWDGSAFSNVEITNNAWGPYRINQIWGTSPGDVYIVGENGNIAHYNGSIWRRVHSGTELTIRDIWGRSADEIYAVGVDRAQVRGAVLKYDGTSWKVLIEGLHEGIGFEPSELFKSQLYGATEALWVDEQGSVYTVGNLMYRYRYGRWDYMRSLPANFLGGNPGNYYRGYLQAIGGNGSNDMFIFGQSETLIHFNGISWKKLGPAYVPWSAHWWYGCEVKGDLAVAVGRDDGGARVITLKR